VHNSSVYLFNLSSILIIVHVPVRWLERSSVVASNLYGSFVYLFTSISGRSATVVCLFLVDLFVFLAWVVLSSVCAYPLCMCLSTVCISLQSVLQYICACCRLVIVIWCAIKLYVRVVNVEVSSVSNCHLCVSFALMCLSSVCTVVSLLMLFISICLSSVCSCLYKLYISPVIWSMGDIFLDWILFVYNDRGVAPIYRAFLILKYAHS